MDYPNDNTESRKNKRLNLKERISKEIRLRDGRTPLRLRRAKTIDKYDSK